MLECSVTELNMVIKNMIEFKIDKNIKLLGEILSIKISNNNIFLILKDIESIISVIFWNFNEKFNFNNGDKVKIEGKVSFYNKSGNINFIGKKIINIGIGDLHKKYQKDFEKFKSLGYFENKKDLPQKISTIGILTAKDGAALQDILYVFNNNNFKCNINIYNCIVQGTSCPKSIIDGITYFENTNNIDLLLITRGGGSFEDLIGFSDPKLIKKINSTKLYTISAVGHEIDNMISDYVSNYRAPTPSIAAEVLSNKFNENINFIKNIENDIDQIVYKENNNLINLESELKEKKQNLPDFNLEIKSNLEFINNLVLEIDNEIEKNILNLENSISSLKEINNSNNHKKILKKGYSLITNDTDIIIKSKDQVDENKIYNLNLNNNIYKIKITFV